MQRGSLFAHPQMKAAIIGTATKTQTRPDEKVFRSLRKTEISRRDDRVAGKTFLFLSARAKSQAQATNRSSTRNVLIWIDPLNSASAYFEGFFSAGPG